MAQHETRTDKAEQNRTDNVRQVRSMQGRTRGNRTKHHGVGNIIKDEMELKVKEEVHEKQ